ncbi:hypothetical protein [Capnocytophaga catalasegens]|nr:hypothetical protein [Capnocytophaga catalasegens]
MDLKNLITHYKKCLNSLGEEAILIGEIPDGATDFSEELAALLTPSHKDFLKICDGGFFGDIVLWNSYEILDSQYCVPEHLQNTAYEIGQILYEPLFMDKTTQTVLFLAENYADMNEFRTDLPTFIKDFAFGENYRAAIIPHCEGDSWWDFLQENRNINL